MAAIFVCKHLQEFMYTFTKLHDMCIDSVNEGSDVTHSMELCTGCHFFDNWQYSVGFSTKGCLV